MAKGNCAWDANYLPRCRSVPALGTFNFFYPKQRIIREVPEYDSSILKIQKVSNKETRVISGPYISVNLLKNDYIKLKAFGFEDLDIFFNE